MFLPQQNAEPCPVHQAEPTEHPLWATLTPVVTVFAHGLRPLSFAISQGALVLAPLATLLGLENAAEQMSRLHTHLVDDNRTAETRPTQSSTGDS